MKKEETCKKLFNIFESDATADLDIADCGTYFFYYNSRKKDWLVQADCY